MKLNKHINNNYYQNINDTMHASLDSATWLLSTIFLHISPVQLLRELPQDEQWEFMTQKAKFEMGVQWLNQHGANLPLRKEERNFTVQDSVNEIGDELKRGEW